LKLNLIFRFTCKDSAETIDNLMIGHLTIAYFIQFYRFKMWSPVSHDVEAAALKPFYLLRMYYHNK
jgi:hypothetical protein